ncbi:MAG: hypothetical protein DRI75_07755 [Bacteroidetes bacterium]|nr:MAG: hypothetical protein DRI75_07755 [Bacteroidota bacterium]
MEQELGHKFSSTQSSNFESMEGVDEQEKINNFNFKYRYLQGAIIKLWEIFSQIQKNPSPFALNMSQL